MEVFSDDPVSRPDDGPPQQFEHRVRWGNVALALAALAAIVLALTLPTGGEAPASADPQVPAPQLAQPTAVTGATAIAPRKPAKNKPRHHRSPRRKQREKRAKPTPAPAPVVAPTPQPAPAPAPAPAQDPTDREFGL
jgi:outer membrane biosynthesis protein TonB